MSIDLQKVHVHFGGDVHFEAFLPYPYPRKTDSIVDPYFSKEQLEAIASWCKEQTYYAAFDADTQAFTICLIRYEGNHLEREGFVRHAFESYLPQIVGKHEGKDFPLYAFAWHWEWTCVPQ